MIDQDKRKYHAAAQNKYREAKYKQGYKRLEIYIPPELWSKLKLRLGHYQPGIALVKLLSVMDHSSDKNHRISPPQKGRK
ncbi:hypothetical protein [Methylomicrobium sp. Wu6]|uniref:hypothetical protein n=1 Tax=Methylomicrobium sp. Wu6 TaxID=3107928 RepID=UPI002DD6B109|nr:hypothetical protein [Methylomicrobium sp. Wu6]MEC4747230.1 hypothetical protein [Methylomicrobium sp. Wu6]